MKNWYDAQTYCKEHPQEDYLFDLVSLNSPEERDFVTSVCNGNCGSWIGLKKANGTEWWNATKWTDGTAYANTIKNWYFGQPNEAQVDAKERKLII